jgi:serine/threonine protein kinase
MPLVEGPTLRKLIKQAKVPISALVETAQAMARLSENEAFRYHGDLKPENILISTSGVKIIDPGYFGPLDCEEGAIASAAITTPAYYPCMEPDDLLAFGLILWECALGIHPLKPSDTVFVEGHDQENFAPELVRWVRAYEQVGYYFLRPILSLPVPTEIKPELPAVLEEVLYKSIGLGRLANGAIEKSSGFKNFREIAEALLNVLLSSEQPEF